MTEIPERVLFEHAFQATPDGNILVNQAGDIALANQSAEKMFGYAQGELEGLSVDMLVPKNLRGEHSRLREGYARRPTPRSMAESRAMKLELWGQRKDGSVFPIETSLSPIPTESGIYVFCVVRDASARVQRELETQRQNELVRLLQDVAIAVNETDSIRQAFQFTIDRICQYLGWPVGRAFLIDDDAGLLPAQIWRSGMSDSYRPFIAATEAIRYRPNMGLPGLVLSTSQPAWLNDLGGNPNFLRQEEARQCHLRTGLALPILVGKEVAGVLEFFHEEKIPPDASLLAVLPHVGMQLGRVIERKRSEEMLRRQAAHLHMLITNLPVILWVVDADGQVLLLEGKGVNNTMMIPQELVGKNIFTQFNDRPEIAALIRRALNGEEIHTEVPSRTGVFFEAFLTPNFDASGNTMGMIGLAFEVSDRKRMENELEEMKRRLMESADAERASLAQQLHDGPLQDLYGAFYQIQEVRPYLQGQELEAASGALQTIQTVNAALRVICGELHPNMLVHLGLQRAIRGHVERIQDREEGAAIVLDLDDDTQPQTSLPHELRLGLYRVFQQLFNNADHHSEASTIWVRFKVNNEQAVLEVQDNGRGFEAPGQWVTLLRERKYGLVTALERVRNMDGKLEIFSRPGDGTLVRVTVPRDASRDARG